MKRKFLLLLVFIFSFFSFSSNISLAEDEPAYTKLRVVDLWTFNEYRYRITWLYFELRDSFKVNWTLNVNVLNEIMQVAKTWYNYLPDNLKNQNYYNNLATSIKRGIKYPNNDSYYSDIVKSIQTYLEDTDIQAITWTIEAVPSTWNAPLTVSLRWRVRDPSWTKLEDYNYIWWIDVWWKRTIIWSKPSISYTLNEEGTFSVFLDVTSNHKNVKWNTDVLPFSSRTDIEVKEKVASLVLNINSTRLRQDDYIKFTPEEWLYWIVFDATSSTPTSWSRFIKTTWDFWNGIEKEYDWPPKVERIKYNREWDFTVSLKLKTNELKTVERKFVVSIHKPIASISTSNEEGFLWDKFTFWANAARNEKNLSYSWEIIDIDRDEIILRKSGSLFTYSFLKKWKFNVKLKVTDPAWETDIDSKIIYINSRAPVASFDHTVDNRSKPNRIFFDATQSYDLDYTDDWALEYSWIIDWERLELEDPNFNWSTWYYSFDSVWEHSVSLEVTDPDGISGIYKAKVLVNSILSVEFFTFPRVIQREWYIRFVADSKEARFFEWDFGDWNLEWWASDKVNHTYGKSWIYTVKLKVRDRDNKTNEFSKVVYVWESQRPYAYIWVWLWSNNEAPFVPDACDWKWAYVVDRVSSVSLKWEESIDVDWNENNLKYSWKVWNDKYFNWTNITYKFDELWCFPVKLTVESNTNKKTDSKEIWIEVDNVKPTLKSIDVNVTDLTTDPVVVNVSAIWAEDRDGIIQSYLWYYYTDIDSEPQDFRSTHSSNTTFVLPKVTWNYYFVVVMKDNNEARVNSDDITWSRYFITLTWDNINTPLIDFRVDDSSVSVWDEVNFSAIVKNILWQDISKDVKYSWDFDGDGFYDKETSSPDISYKYTKWGEFYAKLKVKNKWFSNTKTLVINVVNKLVADFDYISIWDKYIFLNQSLWSYTKYEWDLWDSNKIEWKDAFSHDYEDWKKSHDVELRISDWVKTDKITKKVVSSIKNRLKVKPNSLNLFSLPEVFSWSIDLDAQEQKFFIYMWLSDWDYKYYWVDYDLDSDSDLNWSKDDDLDNRQDTSFITWEPFSIPLNSRKIQKVRLFLLDESQDVYESMDITINKNYIEEQEDIDLDSFVVDWISSSEREKIERLKSMVEDIDQADRLKAKMYVMRLQEEWFDLTEKTRIIIEFEWYVDEIWASNADEIINLLESLLVEWQEDKSEKAITFNALKTLIPQTIECDEKWEFETCFAYLVDLLEQIKDNENLEENKLTWEKILEVIWKTSDMTNEQKLDFKAIIKSFIYGWSENVPDSETPEDVTTEVEPSVDDSRSFISLFKTIWYWFLIIILVILWIILLFFIYYKLTNDDEDVWFQDFILDKTSSWNKWEKDINKDESKKEEDILSSIWWVKKEDKLKEEISFDKNQTKKQDDFWSFNSSFQTKKEDKNYSLNTWFSLDKKDSSKDIVSNKALWETKDSKEEKVPDWLSWWFGNDKKDDKTQEKPKDQKEDLLKPEKNSSDEKVPDWLSGGFATDKKEQKQDNKQEIKSEDKFEKKDEELKKQNPEESKLSENKNTNSLGKWWKKEEEKVPDWLSWSFDDNKKDKTKEKQNLNSKEDLEEITKVKEEKVPDWLSWSLWDDKKADKSEKADEIKKDEKTQEKSKVENKDEKVPEKLKEEEKIDTPNISNDLKKDDPKVPDWLSWSFGDDKKDDKKEESKKQDGKNKDEKYIKSDEKLPDSKDKDFSSKKDDSKDEEAKVPDWLSWSFWEDKKWDKSEKKQEPKKDEKSQETPKLEAKEESKKEDKVKDDKNSKKDENSKKTSDEKKVDDELWDDWMDVPEWLKQPQDKNPKK